MSEHTGEYINAPETESTQRNHKVGSHDSSTQGRTAFASSNSENLRVEMTAFNAACHYAERISPGVTHRLSVADFAAVHQGTIRALSSLTNEGKPLFNSDSLPELKIGPVTSILNSLVHNATQMVAQTTRGLSFASVLAGNTAHMNSGASQNIKNKSTSVEVKKKAKAANVRVAAKPIPKPTPAATKTVAVVKKPIKYSAASVVNDVISKTVKSTASVPLTNVLATAAESSLVTSEASKDTKELSKVDNTGTAKTVTLNSEAALLYQKRTSLFDKCKRSIETSKDWGDLFKVFGYDIKQVKSNIYRMDAEKLEHISRLRHLSLPPLLAIGLFSKQDMVDKSIDWSTRVTLKQVYEKHQALRIKVYDNLNQHSVYARDRSINDAVKSATLEPDSQYIPLYCEGTIAVDKFSNAAVMNAVESCYDLKATTKSQSAFAHITWPRNEASKKHMPDNKYQSLGLDIKICHQTHNFKCYERIFFFDSDHPLFEDENKSENTSVQDIDQPDKVRFLITKNEAAVDRIVAENFGKIRILEHIPTILLRKNEPDGKVGPSLSEGENELKSSSGKTDVRPVAPNTGVDSKGGSNTARRGSLSKTTPQVVAGEQQPSKEKTDRRTKFPSEVVFLGGVAPGDNAGLSSNNSGSPGTGKTRGRGGGSKK